MMALLLVEEAAAADPGDWKDLLALVAHEAVGLLMLPVEALGTVLDPRQSPQARAEALWPVLGAILAVWLVVRFLRRQQDLTLTLYGFLRGLILLVILGLGGIVLWTAVTSFVP